MSKARKKRIEMRVDADTKNMAERASAALGYASLTEYLTRLIREDAPMVLQEQTNISLTNERFDHFIAICDDKQAQASARILEAARRLDDEGL